MFADNVAVTSAPRLKFLHRFATDEIDASYIAWVVNESYDVEFSVNGQHSFRFFLRFSFIILKNFLSNGNKYLCHALPEGS